MKTLMMTVIMTMVKAMIANIKNTIKPYLLRVFSLNPRLLKTGLISFLLLISTNSFAMTVQIFTDSTHPVTLNQTTNKTKNDTVTYYNLDQLKTVVNKMNANLTGKNPTLAEENAKTLIQQYKPQIKHAVNGIQYMHQYNIKKVPTIVFDDGAYQVKGQTNLAVAIQEYQAWKKKNEDEK